MGNTNVLLFCRQKRLSAINSPFATQRAGGTLRTVGHCTWDVAPPREQLQQFGWLTATISHAGGKLTWHRESILDKAAASHFLALCFSPVASERRVRRWSPRHSEASWGRASCFCGGEEQKESQESCCKPRQIPPAAAAAVRAMRRQL